MNEKNMLITEVQILSPLRFNTPFNYLTVHLCKHPHPPLPEPDAHTLVHGPFGGRKNRHRHVDFAAGGQMCNKMDNKRSVCLCVCS